MRFGLPRRFYVDWPGLHPDVKAAAFAAFAELERQGARIVDVDAPTLDVTQAIWGAMLAEMYEYHRDTIREQPENYRAATRLLMLASALRSAADLLRAQRLRARLAREIARDPPGGRRADLPRPGRAGRAVPGPIRSAKELLRPVSRYTNVWNLVGLPACVVPSGFSQEGLPVSIQIVGRPFDDATVLRIARAYERATPWHTRRPDPAGRCASPSPPDHRPTMGPLSPRLSASGRGGMRMGDPMAISENLTGSDILEAARALAPQIRAAADEIERGRRLPLPLVQAMKEAGIFRMPMPRPGAARRSIR